MKLDHPDLPYLVWLAEANLAGDHGPHLVRALGSARAVYDAPLSRLCARVPLSEKERSRLSRRTLEGAKAILARCAREGITILSLTDFDYPAQLAQIYDPPLVLYVRGTLPDLNTLPAVAIVGQRKATPYGLLIAEKLGAQLSRAGVCVVSGMAAGVDAAGHRGALLGGTPTVAVFGCAIDQCYPPANRGLLQEILAHGAAISEYPPGREMRNYYFPRRNRIISGLSLGVVVAEAPMKSGSLITANLALEQGRDVFAVPQSVDAPAGAGCNELIAGGAKLVRSAEDILEEYRAFYNFFPLGDETPVPAARPQPHAAPPPGNIPMNPVPLSRPDPGPKAPPPPTGDPILDALDTPLQLDELARRTGLSASTLMGKLTLLELRGAVRQLPGQVYEKTATPF